jgi:hypothetical protein
MGDSGHFVVARNASENGCVMTGVLTSDNYKWPYIEDEMTRLAINLGLG